MKKSQEINFPSGKEFEKIRKKLSSPKYIGSMALHPNASTVDRIKYSLCEEIVRYSRKSELSQVQLAKILKINKTEMSRVLHYRIERYTIDRLIGYVEILYPKMKFTMKVKSA